MSELITRDSELGAIVEGANVTVESILEAIKGRSTVQKLSMKFHLTDEQVIAALEFAQACLPQPSQTEVNYALLIDAACGFDVYSFETPNARSVTAMGYG